MKIFIYKQVNPPWTPFQECQTLFDLFCPLKYESNITTIYSNVDHDMDPEPVVDRIVHSITCPEVSLHINVALWYKFELDFLDPIFDFENMFCSAIFSEPILINNLPPDVTIFPYWLAFTVKTTKIEHYYDLKFMFVLMTQRCSKILILRSPFLRLLKWGVFSLFCLLQLRVVGQFMWLTSIMYSKLCACQMLENATTSRSHSCIQNDFTINDHSILFFRTKSKASCVQTLFGIQGKQDAGRKFWKLLG